MLATGRDCGGWEGCGRRDPAPSGTGHERSSQDLGKRDTAALKFPHREEDSFSSLKIQAVKASREEKQDRCADKRRKVVIRMYVCRFLTTMFSPG
jgi:hypothetical protein